jgi:hypothetical protein
MAGFLHDIGKDVIEGVSGQWRRLRRYMKRRQIIRTIPPSAKKGLRNRR